MRCLVDLLFRREARRTAFWPPYMYRSSDVCLRRGAAEAERFQHQPHGTRQDIEFQDALMLYDVARFAVLPTRLRRALRLLGRCLRMLQADLRVEARVKEIMYWVEYAELGPRLGKRHVGYAADTPFWLQRRLALVCRFQAHGGMTSNIHVEMGKPPDQYRTTKRVYVKTVSLVSLFGGEWP